ncbi:MAG: DUF2806 domain-containing protein, partial [Phenylobacterium sp.]
GKSRALAAVDMLLGGVIGAPAAAAEAFRRRLVLRGQVREAMIRADAARALEVLREVSDLGQATASRFIEQELRKQTNREAVWIETEEQLRALPPPQPTDDAEPTEDMRPLDEDWLNLFSRHAEEATSERLRQLWGRILAGEIRRPGSFAPTTLRAIAELDAEIASKFQRWAELIIDGRLLRVEDPEGELLDELTFLEEVGLLQEANGNLVNRISLENGFAHIFGEEWGLRVTPRGTPERVEYPIMNVTRVGRQIANILPRDEVRALKAIGERLENTGKAAPGESQLFCIDERRGDRVRFTFKEWPET